MLRRLRHARVAVREARDNTIAWWRSQGPVWLCVGIFWLLILVKVYKAARYGA